jgi:hypothetical protein
MPAQCAEDCNGAVAGDGRPANCALEKFNVRFPDGRLKQEDGYFKYF